MERSTGTEVYGCGSAQTTDITLNIQTTTGGNFSISLNGKQTVEHLKKLVSKKLKVSKDRICLLHRERQLREGTLEDNGLLDGSRVILLPSVETGLLSQRPENSVMQALESLNDTQVNDFLSGKSPLNLTMRLGDHMMLIQLQLSTLSSVSASTVRSLRTSTPTKSSTTSSSLPAQTKSDIKASPSPQGNQQKPTEVNDSNVDKSNAENNKTKPEIHTNLLHKKDLEILQNAFEMYHRSVAEEKSAEKNETCEHKQDSSGTSNGTISNLSDTSVENEQSPIKSLSNLVSSPIDASATENRDAAIMNSVRTNLIDFLSQNKISEQVTPTTSTACAAKQCASTSSHTPDSSFSDDSDSFADQSLFLTESTIDEYPMENLFNSAVDKGLFQDQDECMMDREISNLATTSHGQETNTGMLPSFQSINEPLKNKRFQYLLHKTSKFKHPIGQNKQKAFMQSVVNKHKKRMQNLQDNNLVQPSTSRTEPYITNSRKLILQPSSSTQTEEQATPSTSRQVSFRPPDAPKKPQRASPTPTVDTKALIEASKNLTQKLKKLSKEVLTNKVDLRMAEESVRSKIGPGAVIESMKHHGKGVYSGTFSGTLNPALQDRYGRPKRDISTIIHILNDLLCATPQIALSQKDSSFSCGSIDEQIKCTCSQPSCSYGQCDGHIPSTSTASIRDCLCKPKDCQCIRVNPELCASCASKATTEEICKKCDTAKTLAMENSKTKCKLEQLGLSCNRRNRDARRGNSRHCLTRTHRRKP
ncbi:hypothetical protein O3G_MSEX012920 [Manduca sexta]|uniref:Ubiquitin-like domain-containing protein n=1 Tax=Manduca sexta TaxID=7130 RepID=A0A922CXH5_MANSE|nr:hypothetical protein O3G_MSEX012920 [Manduca sexta]